MSETTASLWTLEAPPPRWGRWLPMTAPLAAGLLIGALLGAALTVLAGGPIRASWAAQPAATAAEWTRPALDREWRGYRTPVDVDRMFRKR